MLGLASQPSTLTVCPVISAFHSYSYMIDNVILLITGTLHQRSIAELVPKCHPLGSFEQMEAVNIAQTPAELYNAILVDTPLGEPLWWKQQLDSGLSIRASVWVLWIVGGGAALKQETLLLLSLPFPQLPILIVSHPTSFPFPMLFLGRQTTKRPD